MNTTESEPTRREVLVIGAGPVGLTAAIALRSQGHAVTVIEAEPEGRNRAGSRAIFVHKETLKLLEKMRPGLGREIASHGLVWPTKRTLWRGRQVFVRHYPAPSPDALPPFSSLPQVEIERYLFKACKDAGVEFAWNTPVSGVESSNDAVKITTESGQTWLANYVVAADGARSGVRRALGIPMEGSRSTNSYIIVDVAEDPDNPLPQERVFHYGHKGVGGRNVMLVPFVGGWRVDLECNDDDDPEVFSGMDGVKQWLPKVMPPAYAERITWISTYQFLQVLARDFIDPNYRVLLIGEAAHLFAPFGARGMNSGVADAAAAAIAIHTALSTTDPATAHSAVKEFARQRRSAAEYNRAAARQALDHVHKRSIDMRLKRSLAALIAPYWEPAGIWLDSGPYGPRKGTAGQTASKY
ncbi:MAG: FAD-dependent monooxygenase [Ktedonobacteraceae bacterium]